MLCFVCVVGCVFYVSGVFCSWVGGLMLGLGCLGWVVVFWCCVGIWISCSFLFLMVLWSCFLGCYVRSVGVVVWCFI